MKCHVCQSTVLVESYQVGSVLGHLCAVCMQGAGIALASWSVKRMRELQRERQLAEVRSEVLDEQLPLSTRRAMKASVA